MPPLVDRERLPEEWPTNACSPAFWEELGRTVAAFGHLEDMLARAFLGLTGSREFADMEEAEAAYPQWEKALKETLTDTLHALTARLEKAFKDDDRVSDDIAEPVVARLKALRVWRNALCHGAWQGFAADGTSSLRYFRKTAVGPELLENGLTIDDNSSIRAETAALTLDVVDIVSGPGVRFPGTALPGIDLAEYMRESRD